MNALTALVLRPGDAVELRGQLAARRGSIVLTGLDMLHPAPGEMPELRWEATPYVTLDEGVDAARAPSSWRAMLGATVFGTGTWTGRFVTGARLSVDDGWTTSVAIPTEYRKDLTPVSDHARTVEAALFSSGVVLRRVRLVDAVGPRVLVSATDVDAARRALEPLYGGTLEIFESRWTASELRELDDVLNDLHDDVVLKVKYRMDGDGVISRKLRVPFVDDALVRALRVFPDDMLVVEALVEPAGTPQDRDPWFPPHRRL